MNVEVRPHAVDRALERRHYPPAISRAQVAVRIRAEVLDAVAAGRVLDRKPVWAQLRQSRERCGGKPRARVFAAGERFLYDDQRSRGWIVETVDDVLVVLTAVHRVRPLEQERAA